jgi:thiamine-monophosphate kinase
MPKAFAPGGEGVRSTVGSAALLSAAGASATGAGVSLAASGAAVVLSAGGVPLSPQASALIAAHAGARETALTGGDDYEILASVPPQNAAAFETRAAQAGVAVTRIGHVVHGEAPPQFRDAEGGTIAFARGSYSHI